MSNEDLYDMTPPTYECNPAVAAHQSHVKYPTYDAASEAAFSTATPETSVKDNPPEYGSMNNEGASSPDFVPCSLRADKPALFEVKRQSLRLSGLAATVLLKEKILKPKDLQVLPYFLALDDDRDPTDPLSAVLFATADTVGQILHGVAESPMTAATSSNPAKGAAVGAGKGLARVVGAGLKAPMNVTYGVARGFHNIPALYGEQVRHVGRITDFKSGMVTAGKGLGYGLYDGVTGFFKEPIKGAGKEGGVGFAKGFGKGLTGLVCKPAAGAVGVPGYAFRGVYKEMQGAVDPNSSQSVSNTFFAVGED